MNYLSTEVLGLTLDTLILVIFSIPLGQFPRIFFIYYFYYYNINQLLFNFNIIYISEYYLILILSYVLP